MVRRFFRFVVAGAIVAGAMLAPLHSQQAPPQGTARQNTGTKRHLALVGGMLIDGYDVPPVHHAAILIGNTHERCAPVTTTGRPALTSS
jgi:hypothetical protein